MTVATIPSTPTSRTAVDLDVVGQAALVGGDFFLNDGNKLLVINNGGGAPITLTVVVAKTIDGLAVPNRTYTITNGTHHYVIGPFSPGVYNDGSQMVSLTYSAVTSVTVSVLSPGSQ